VRARAATALGRLWWPEQDAEITAALVAALADEHASVRAAAAFGLGLRGDPAAGEALARLAADREGRDPHPLVRARAVEALSKLDRPDLHEAVLAGLADPDAAVRLEAAEGTHRWPRDAADAERVDGLLVRHLDDERDRSVAEYTLFALQRRAASAGLPVFLVYARSARPIERLYAVRGLKALAPAPEVRDPLLAATRDDDWRIACEAVLALGAFPMRPTYAALDAATRASNPHVRRCAWETVADQLAEPTNAGDRELWRAALRAMEPLDDPSTSVRAAFTGAQMLDAQLAAGGFVPEDGWIEALEAGDQVTDEELIAVAGALGRGPHGPALATALDVLARTASPRVAGAAIEALGSFDPADARSKLQAFLADQDLGLRLAAVLALGEMPAPEDLPLLVRAYETSSGDIAPEIRFNVLRVAARADPEGALELLRRGCDDPRPFVRRVAAEEYTRVAGHAPEGVAAHEPAAPATGRPLPTFDRNPVAVVETTRGTMTFELFGDEAPIHVHNFVTLAGRGAYDGRIFHRVVPDFVIQGGDYRGDGNGGTTWRGADSLREEIGPRKYVRGSLGMPRNEDPDSGGSQLFVTHRPTPHLDGRYTIFGELREGFDVLDAIEVGDRILAVRVSNL